MNEQVRYFNEQLKSDGRALYATMSDGDVHAIYYAGKLLKWIVYLVACDEKNERVKSAVRKAQDFFGQ